MEQEQMNHSPVNPEQPAGAGCLRKVGMGCLIIFILLTGIAAYLVYNWRALTASLIDATVEKILEENKELAPEEKTKLRDAIKRVTKRVKSGEMDLQEFEALFEKFQEGPLFLLTLFRGFEVEYVENSVLSAEEKTEANLNFDRFIRGMVEKKISSDRFEEFYQGIPKDSYGEIKETLSLEEIRTVLNKAKEITDQAGIPREKYNLDIAKEVDALVDSVLQNK